jgi:hypothetical protein
VRDGKVLCKAAAVQGLLHAAQLPECSEYNLTYAD